MQENVPSDSKNGRPHVPATSVLSTRKWMYMLKINMGLQNHVFKWYSASEGQGESHVYPRAGIVVGAGRNGGMNESWKET